MSSPLSNSKHWWREAVFYQVYPLSFADSDGNGYGDIDGIVAKLAYLGDVLGVDALWLSPFYRSPMRDWGYDISDHTDVDPIFGDISSAELLIDEAHNRGLRVIFDYIMNHTSNEHPWFIESASSRDNPKRDWYVWEDPKKDGSPPNNWVSVFSGPAWTFDDTTGQYYRHTYLVHQPDLNWRNPELVEAMLDVARFWLDRGVDGFRVDAAHQMMKDPLNRDNPPTPPDYHRPWKDMGEYDDFIHLYDLGHPDVHIAHREFRKLLDTYPHHPVSVGEIHIFDLPEWASYYGEDLDQFHMPFNFHLMATQWEPVRVRATIESVLWNVPVGAWTNWTMGNHDEIRLATRVGEDQSRLVALLLLTLRGTPFLYYGDEIGMKEVDVPVDRKKDPWGIRVNFLSRDGARTPMQWDGTADGGFAMGEAVSDPWLPVGPDVATINVESELADPNSMLNLYRRIIRFRKGSPALRRGSYLSHPSSNEEVLVYRRESDDETITVALNFSSAATSVEFRAGRVVLSTLDPARSDEFRKSLDLAPREGVIVAH
ncbi:MAG: alpha-amylase family glycosyl hydrolase [Acidimicrobiia bacterium]|nr:alpha-amylase family glycosyl hydrolase [Acidimicrobiia bacterium]MDH3463831.1 alpha-amylase family glycosyl hydrolase [Acidimicrobiia bacterium]